MLGANQTLAQTELIKAETDKTRAEEERIRGVDTEELHVVSDMRARKGMIEQLADCFIALPGGIGTLEELFEIWVGRYLGFHSKPTAVLDPNSVYSTLRIALDDLTDKNFMKPGQHELVAWCSSIDEALAHVTKI